MKPLYREVYGSTATFSNGVLVSTGDCLSSVTQVNCPGTNIRGDRDAPNPFWFRVHRQTGDEFYSQQSGVANGAGFVDRSASTFYIRQAAFPSLNDPVEADYSVTDDRCMEKIYDQIRGSSNMVVDFAEGGATLKMIANLRKLRKSFIKQVVGATKSKKYRGLTNGQQRLDFLTEKWLEYRYGWLPLVYSTYDALETLHKQVTGGYASIKGRSGVSVKTDTSSGLGSFSSPTIRKVRHLRYRSEVAIRFKLPDTLQLYDWTSLNPLGIAWELTPLSFVADWFVNVGDTLSLWENYLIYRSRFDGGYRTRSYFDQVDTMASGISRNPVIYAPNGDPFDGLHLTEIGWSDTLIRKGMNREILTELPMPSSGVRFKVKLNAERLLDAAGLFHVFTKKVARDAHSVRHRETS